MTFTAEWFENHLRQNLSTRAQNRLSDAMAYSLLSGGKRLRPLLVLQTAQAIAGHLDPDTICQLALPAATAVEYVHTYSLIHDDLPAMDNDDLRRGKPTCHRQFDEATAILAGDALLSDAFLFLSTAKIKPARQCFELAKAIGSQGMVQGQMDDLISKQAACDEKDWLLHHAQKTGRLFEAACVLGGLSVDALPHQIEGLRQYGAAFGLAFQLLDDLNDQNDFFKIVGAAHIQSLVNEQKQKALLALSELGASSAALEHLLFGTC